jgi:hypothetical protein
MPEIWLTALPGQSLKNMPVENPSANESRAVTHHAEQDLFSLLTDQRHTS